MRCSCGCEWWTDRREIKPAAGPSQDPQLQTTAREIRYRLVCVQCGQMPDDNQTDRPRKARKVKTNA